MKRSFFSFLGAIAVVGLLNYSCSEDYMQPEQKQQDPHLKGTSLRFNTTSSGTRKAISYWGIGWIGNTDASIKKMGGAHEIDVVRIGCPKEWALDGGSLTADAKADIDKQMGKATKVTSANPNTKIALVCSGGKSPGNPDKGIHSWYVQSNGKEIIGSRWLALFKATKNYVRSNYNLDIAYIEVCNEQDYGGKVGTKGNFNNILAKFQSDSELGAYPMVGPSTLSANAAANWYSPMKGNLDWGATHAIGGSGTKYVDFVKKVRSDGKEYFGSEVHNLVEMIIGADHGAIGGLWWNTVKEEQGLFSQYCQQGNRICYEKVKSTFSAACGYKGAQTNTIHLFAASIKGETFTFNCSDRDVYFDGQGPQKNYTVNVPKNGEVYVKVTW